jgi:hypothetical protein
VEQSNFDTLFVSNFKENESAKTNFFESMENQSIIIMDIVVDDERGGNGSTPPGTEPGASLMAQSIPETDDSRIEGQVRSCEWGVVHGDTHEHGSQKADTVETNGQGTTIDTTPSPSNKGEDSDGGCSGTDSSAGMRLSERSVTSWQHSGED